MHNYYNIIPSVLLDILVIFLLEGIVFYKFLFPMEKELASKQLSEFGTKLQESINNLLSQVALNNDIKTEIKEQIMLITNQEKIYLNESSTYFLIVFGFTCAGLLTLVYIYHFVCKYMLDITIDWASILIALFFIVICIIGFEIIYFVYILLNKKINNQKIIKYFIDNAFETFEKLETL